MEKERGILLEKGARLVNERAKIVLNILNEEELEIRRNKNFPLNVMAITAIGYDGEELCEEVGLHRTKPFRPSEVGRVGRRNKRRTCIPGRDFFSPLTEEQYELVAPSAFQLLQEIVDERVAGWKRGPHNPIWLWSPYFRYSKTSKKLYLSWRAIEWPRGLRFSVRRDSFFAKDVCWAELNSNSVIQNYLKGLANFIGLCLRDYQRGWKRKMEFKSLARTRQVLRVLETKTSLPSHLLSEVMNYLPGGQNGNHLWTEISELIGWDGSDSEEKQMSAQALLDPPSRLGNIQIRTVHNGGDCLTFEVFPTK